MISVVATAVLLVIVAYYFSRPAANSSDAEASRSSNALNSSTSAIPLTPEQQEAIGLKTFVAVAGIARNLIRAPARVTPDETKYAHITSRAAGVVRSVTAQIGQDVKAGDLLATLDSPEVAQARFDLMTRTQELEVATSRAEWQEEISAATLELIDHLKKGDSPEEIKKRFEGRAVGENREKLLTAESQLRVTLASERRNKEMLNTKAVSLAQYQVVLAEYEAAMATYQSLIDRMGVETRLANTRAKQDKRQAETAVRIARGRLRALGVPSEREAVPDLPTTSTAQPPGATAPAMSYYEIHAPFGGTVLDREMLVPGVPIDLTHRIFLLADLSSVWVEASIHESDFDQLEASRGGDVKISSAAFPERDFPGLVLYTGDLVDEKSRTIKLLARADNPERLLKPGMFVNVEIRGKSGRPAAMVPESAVLTAGDAAFVYVRTGPKSFERREVTLGTRENNLISVLTGLKVGEEVVVEGAFKLKAEHLRLVGGG